MLVSARCNYPKHITVIANCRWCTNCFTKMRLIARRTPALIEGILQKAEIDRQGVAQSHRRLQTEVALTHFSLS